MKIAIGSDHAGYKLKNEIIEFLQEKNIEVIDEGTYGLESVDYPDFAVKVCNDYVTGKVDYGILVCYTGIGMSMAANKTKGVRAALVGIKEDAVLTREHNNANVLCLSAKNTSTNLALEIVETFLNTEFTAGRHERRVQKVMDIENE
ncbi:MAG: ribose 5-phosphate isomerase B [Bacilli bacterium]|nr:ribose 5-phosphate isomerase B [Bacilli bacterium]